MTRLLSFGMFALCALLALGLLLASGAAQARRLALVIGNDNYQQVSSLDKAGSDAEAMARELTAAGFEVHKHRDLTFRKTVLAFEEFYDKVKGGDEVVVFYAGHGVQTDRGSYLLPIDVEGETTSQVEKISYSVQGMLEELDRIKARFSLIVIDACRDNPLRSRGRTIGIARGLAAPDLARGQMVIMSAGRNQRALDSLSSTDTHPNGVFTRELVGRMRSAGLSVERLALEVKGAVEKLAMTVNHEQRPLIINESSGEFFFYPLAGGTPAVEPSVPAGGGLSAAAREDKFWEGVRAADTAEGYQAYVDTYPTGHYLALARANIKRLADRQVTAGGRPPATALSAPAAAGAVIGEAAKPAAPLPPADAGQSRVPTAPASPALAAPAAATAAAAATTAAPAVASRSVASYTLPGGDRYEGEVQGDKRHGQGTYSFANGDRYTGSFVDGNVSGHGLMEFANGDRYEGGFTGTTRQGRGVMVFANKGRYEGDFVDNLYHGKGTFTFATGERYSGDYQRGIKQGQGEYVFANRDRYVGQFEADKPHGKGTMTFASGDQAQGTYVAGIQQGEGSYRFANGDRYEGGFLDGLFSGKGRLVLASGDRYEGEFRQNVKEGQGTHFFANKDRYEGQFKGGLQHGQGTHFFANGDTYTGEFVAGLRHGKGVHRFASGQSREMEYVNGTAR